MKVRPILLIIAVFAIGACQKPLSDGQLASSNHLVDASPTGFVRVNKGRFELDEQPYTFVGTNLWYGAYLGSPDKALGNRARLVRELDLLKRTGINNLRVLGGSESSSLVNAMSPAITEKGGHVREDLLEGLDYLLAEMAKRDMKAVIYLTNFWEWSGGMATYLSWANGGQIVDPSDPQTPWPAFALFSAKFYSDDKAKAYFNHYVRSLLSRKNTVTGKLYRQDPTIMSWQLANEPRPGDGKPSLPNLSAYYQWISDSVTLIKSLAPQHLVSLGGEGVMGCLELEGCVLTAHKNTGLDYMTFHMWLKNWRWFDVDRADETYPSAKLKALTYIRQHQRLATQLNMPLVLEEFGLDRDNGSFSTASSVSFRDDYFQLVFSEIEKSIQSGGPLVGSNFWAWGGYGRAQQDDAVWRDGNTSFVGDPPQEPQGLNSVFDADNTTLTLISEHAQKLERL